MMKQLILIFAAIVSLQQVNAQVLSTRTAHISVESGNNIQDIEADNYQAVCQLNTETGQFKMQALLKSFEFKIGAINRLLNTRKLDVTQNPKIKFDGKVTNIEQVNFAKPGKYEVEVLGTLYIWDEQRKTKYNATLTVNENGSVQGLSAFPITIEEMNVDKINDIMRQKLPAVLAIDVDRLGISRNINIEAEMLLQ